MRGIGGYDEERITHTCSLSVFQVHDVLLSCMDLKGLMPSGPQTKRASCPQAHRRPRLRGSSEGPGSEVP